MTLAGTAAVATVRVSSEGSVDVQLPRRCLLNLIDDEALRYLSGKGPACCLLLTFVRCLLLLACYLQLIIRHALVVSQSVRLPRCPSAYSPAHTCSAHTLHALPSTSRLCPAPLCPMSCAGPSRHQWLSDGGDGGGGPRPAGSSRHPLLGHGRLVGGGTRLGERVREEHLQAGREESRLQAAAGVPRTDQVDALTDGGTCGVHWMLDAGWRECKLWR